METNKQLTGPRFTVVRVPDEVDSARGHNRYGRRYGRHSRPSSSVDGLLFESTDEVKADARVLVTDPTLQKALGPILALTEEPQGLLIHGDMSALPTPDRASPSDVVYYNREGSLKSFRVLDRFMQCHEPSRDLLGCKECPHVGLPCMSGEVHGVPVVASGDPPDSEDLRKSFEDRVTTIAGYHYVSPVLLAEESETFVTSARLPQSIHWEAEEERRKQRKFAAASAALTRNFKKTECGVCPAKEGGCTSFRYCRGAYEPADNMAQRLLARWQPRLEKVTEGALQPWQLYAVMWNGGAAGVRAWDRRRVVLGGLVYENERFRVRIAASQSKADESHAWTEDWERLCKVFPVLPRTEREAVSRKPTETQIALYFAALEARRFGPVLRSFQGYQQDLIGWLTLESEHVTVVRSRPYGIRSRDYQYHKIEIGSWANFYSAFKLLPGDKRPTRPEIR